jgi:5-formyltetrahydrofolate cyclo-ligase
VTVLVLVVLWVVLGPIGLALLALGLGLLAYACVLGVRLGRQRPDWRGRVWLALGIVLLGLIAAALAIWQALPGLMLVLAMSLGNDGTHALTAARLPWTVGLGCGAAALVVVIAWLRRMQRRIALDAEKAQLRDLLKARRAEAARSPGAADAVAAHALALPVWQAGAVVAGYWPIRDELDPRALMQALAARGLVLALPRTSRHGSPGPLSFHAFDLARPDLLDTGAFGLREPPATAATVTPDILLLPLLGFDRAGGRIGWGQGHYDRTLAALEAAGRRVVTIGLAYGAQEVDAVPSAPHDRRLDWIVTETGAYGAGAAFP